MRGRNPFGKLGLDLPSGVPELLARAEALAGQSVMDVADALDVPLPTDAGRDKGFVGQLVEVALGAAAGNEPHPDFAALGVELKTVPVGSGGPTEATFVTTIDYAEVREAEWARSRVRAKLARVLFVPVEAAALRLGARTFGAPTLWTPSPEVEAVLAADYELLRARVIAGELKSISARDGTYLHVRPKGQTSRARTRVTTPDGEVWARRLGFYLRSRLTREIVGPAMSAR